MNLSKKTILLIPGFIFLVLLFGLAGNAKAQTACPSASTPGLLLCEDFNDQQLDSRMRSWSSAGTMLSSPQYNLASVGRGGSGYCFSSGTVNEANLVWRYDIPNPWPSDEMYFSMWMRYPTYTNTDTMENFKLFYPHWNGTASYVHYSAVDNNGIYYSASGNGEMISISNWLNCPNQMDGNWHHYEFYVKFSTAISRFWYDGVLKLDHNYADGSWNPSTMYYIWAPSIDAEEDGVLSRQVDDWQVWDRMPNSSATCSNCCSTTQTCPTAMTTVGSCTRCCATACQTASTDTTLPVVSAFSVTPATLTVGASITANYTVTDNTALARAELWRASAGTNCTDTVKTGCTWTQVTSTNITGTSRTGTFTSTPTAAGTFYYGLHAVDAAGNVGSESAAVRVTVNAQTQTCTNCCSTTQTCPTAMTTVGTCTRCCATTCQTVTSGSPVINSISGNIFNNSPITISGSGFGAKTVAAPVLWDRVDNISSYSNLTNGATIPVGGSNPWPSPYGNSSGDGLVKYNTSDTQRGISTAQYKATNAVAGYLDGLTWTATNYAYVSWWWKQDRDVSGGDHSSKFLRMSNVSDETGKTFSFTQMANYVYGPDGYCQNSGGLQWDGWGGNANSWNFIETWFNSSNRTYTIRINGQELSNNISWSGCSAFSFNELWKIGFDGGGTNPPAITWWMDDIYVDNTFSRVMLGNASTYSASTHLEMQTPTAWSTNSVTINANQGSFTPGQTAYLYIIDANGNASNGYPVTIGGGPSATCSNCCSTTQTCPTAFTTVGTCTRCCASTCQTTSACGNGNCQTGETCSSCASDCGACPGGQCQKLSSGSAIPAGYGAPYNTLY